jgi:hypothetical protein
MKRLQSLILAVLLLGALTSPAWADDDHQGQGNGNGLALGRIFHRGEDSVALTLASGRAAGGQADPRVPVTPDGGSSQSAVVCSNVPDEWAGPIRASHWVSLQADCTADPGDSTNFTYSATFNLPPNPTSVRIMGQVLADDSVTIQLNRTTIFTGGGFTSPSTFSSNDSSLFQGGTNTLTFIVNNVTGPSGLDFVAHVQAANRSARGNHSQDDNGDD